uniref:Uncharacterized protein n=1 Tax=Klebsiella pneumoniae TaxID=573 RepID=A0A7S5L2Y6_KLEPN|nr:hypothetical protein pKpnB199_00221 [Klebsiella pneumoniae]QGW58800.1 hypothetical protein pKpnB199_00334 [Klebsiella pneumoniae]
MFSRVATSPQKHPHSFFRFSSHESCPQPKLMYAYISIKYPVQQKSGNRSDLVHVAVSFGLSLLRYGIQVTPPPSFPAGLL